MQAQTYWNLLEMRRGSELTLTKIDEEIHAHFKTAFPEIDVEQKIDEEAMKSKEGKERWRAFIKPYENTVNDFNFGTLLRYNPKDEYGEHSTMFGGSQFLSCPLEGHILSGGSTNAVGHLVAMRMQV
ncbi:hypothetical protein ABW19_dt0201623 [Dactylella cylindrospora]|nr:hypothetical protein ABW19_dt0201623 [Dactylella cylindrospora]